MEDEKSIVSENKKHTHSSSLIPLSHPKLKFFQEILGLSPYKLRWQQAMIAIRGGKHLPRSKAGLSALKHLYFYYGPKMWMGTAIRPRTVVISNLFNHTQTPYQLGWSVKKTQVLDFRQGQLTYDSHNGTDFAIIPGSKVCTAAAGYVVHILSEFNRGGLKVFIDHGQGLMTCYAHLARSLVQVGDYVQRGQIIALSGYSGLDALLTFPWGLPHVHFNVWLNGVPIDPFPTHEQEISMWRSHAMPQPILDYDICTQTHEQVHPSIYDKVKLQAAIHSCLIPEIKSSLLAITDLKQRAAQLIATRNYYPTRFTQHDSIYATTHTRRAILDLPFAQVDFDHVAFLDQL